LGGGPSSETILIKSTKLISLSAGGRLYVFLWRCGSQVFAFVVVGALFGGPGAFKKSPTPNQTCLTL